MGTSFSLKSLSELLLTSLFEDKKITDLVLLSFTTHRKSCTVLRILWCVEDIKVFFTNTHKVWVVFLEVVIQSSLTVKVDVITMRAHFLLLVVTLCDAVYET